MLRAKGIWIRIAYYEFLHLVLQQRDLEQLPVQPCCNIKCHFYKKLTRFYSLEITKSCDQIYADVLINLSIINSKIMVYVDVGQRTDLFMYTIRVLTCVFVLIFINDLKLGFVCLFQRSLFMLMILICLYRQRQNKNHKSDLNNQRYIYFKV